MLASGCWVSALLLMVVMMGTGASCSSCSTSWGVVVFHEESFLAGTFLRMVLGMLVGIFQCSYRVREQALETKIS